MAGAGQLQALLTPLHLFLSRPKCYRNSLSTICSGDGTMHSTPKSILPFKAPSESSKGGSRITYLATTSFLRSSVVYGCRRGIPSNLTSSSLGKEFSLSMSSHDCKPNWKKGYYLGKPRKEQKEEDKDGRAVT